MLLLIPTNVKHRVDVDYFIEGENLIPINEFPLEIASKSGLIYEVIRINKAKPLFLKEHLNRLLHSVEILSFPKFDLEIIKGLVYKLIDANKINIGNIKLVISSIDDSSVRPYLYFIPHRYPSDMQIKEGVKTLLQYDERKMPQVKIADWNIRGRANNLIDSEGVYETLLVNSNDEITEGSRSNVFFISNNDLITAADKDVLSGITREKVLELAIKLNINIIYKSLPVNGLTSIDAAFITGTSPGVLQVKRIGDIKIKVNNPIYVKINNAFNKLQNELI